jgi:hypothetical protein
MEKGIKLPIVSRVESWPCGPAGAAMMTRPSWTYDGRGPATHQPLAWPTWPITIGLAQEARYANALRTRSQRGARAAVAMVVRSMVTQRSLDNDEVFTEALPEEGCIRLTRSQRWRHSVVARR